MNSVVDMKWLFLKHPTSALWDWDLEALLITPDVEYPLFPSTSAVLCELSRCRLNGQWNRIDLPKPHVLRFWNIHPCSVFLSFYQQGRCGAEYARPTWSFPIQWYRCHQSDEFLWCDNVSRVLSRWKLVQNRFAYWISAHHWRGHDIDTSVSKSTVHGFKIDRLSCQDEWGEHAPLVIAHKALLS